MEYLLRTADGRTRRYIKFHGKHMQFALHSGLDMFEVKSDVRIVEDLDRLRTGIKSEVENITGILDQIMLNEYLFPPTPDPSPALPPAQ
jgi:hypothetical protein